MAAFSVRFLPGGETVSVPAGTSVLAAGHKAGVFIDAPCGGEGLCGNCTVWLQENGTEQQILSCQYPVDRDLTVRVPVTEGHNILETGIDARVQLAPLITRRGGELIMDGLPMGSCDPAKPIFAMAFDIGTTTIVGYLLDLETGDVAATASMLNPQSQFGADVISRSNYAIANGVAPLRDAVRGALNELISKACGDAGCDKTQIVLLTVVGNTCMHHLFLGISPQSLVVAPYTAATVEPQLLPAAELGLGIHPDGVVLTLPNISGFVGADTVGAILSSRMDRESPVTLLIDIGTNGEMALGNDQSLVTCSTAAGPAFEGALISCGMRGAEGAVDHVSFPDGRVEFSVIGGGEAKGICGSGLIDLIAGLVEVGVIDETGRLLTADEAEDELAEKIAAHVQTIDGLRTFVLTNAVTITQKDVRELQLAKAAMAAGVQLLMEARGITVRGIDRVMLAGAFGNYMSPHSACVIGLIPRELEDKILPIGNAAGEGAKAAALSGAAFRQACNIGEGAGYLELAGMPEFQDVFVDQMLFE